MTQTIPALKIAQAFIAEELAVNTIAVFRSETGWNARYGGPHAASIIELLARTRCLQPLRRSLLQVPCWRSCAIATRAAMSPWLK